MLRDGWRLAAGTFTALPWPPPARVDRTTARAAVLLAPLAALPLGVAVAGVGLAGRGLALPPVAVGLLALGVLALLTRVLHWDGLSDVADGLTASYDRERSLAVMKSGTAGPAGVVAVVVVAGLQVAGLAPLLTTGHGCLVAGLAVVAARWALLLTCVRGVPPARPDGLGLVMAGVVPRAVALAGWAAVAVALGLLTDGRGAVAALAAVIVVGVLTRRAHRRFGGVTGDVYGAAIELTAATLLVALA